MKKIAIMQPYLFPYLGYFQLISSVEIFVIYDDVQWIKGGWINRNRIYTPDGIEYITLPVKKDSHLKSIRERYFVDNIEFYKMQIIDRLTESYGDAPFFNETMALVNTCLDYDESNVALFVSNSLRECCDYLGVSTQMVFSSSIDKDDSLTSQDKVININKILGSGQYINPIGGQQLYDNRIFTDNGIKLNFIMTKPVSYRQFNYEYIPNLSIVDILMFNSKHKVKEMLGYYELV